MYMESDDQRVPEVLKVDPAKTSLVHLEEDSTECTQVQRLFRSTLPNARIADVSRIDNPWLLESYEWHRHRIAVKKCGFVNEKYLFHGTRCNDPANLRK